MDGGEAVPGTAVKARPTSSAQAVAHADRAGSAGSDASKANSSTAFNAALAEAVEGALDSFPPSNTANDAAVNSSKDVQHGSSSPRPSESVSAPTTLAADPALAPQAAWGIASPAPQVVALYQPGSTQDTSAEEAAWAEQIPAATEEVSDPDCIGNPLYEEPDPVRQVPVAAAEPALLPASHPALPSSAPEATAELPVPSVGHPEQGMRPVLDCMGHYLRTMPQAALIVIVAHGTWPHLNIASFEAQHVSLAISPDHTSLDTCQMLRKLWQADHAIGSAFCTYVLSTSSLRCFHKLTPSTQSQHVLSQCLDNLHCFDVHSTDLLL